MSEEKIRCEWCLGAPEFIDYHDMEWGVPVHDDPKHFEFLILEGAQAGLSWITILKRREGYQKAFAHFDPSIVATYDSGMIEELLQDPGIIRNRLKVESTVNNAQRFLEIQKEYGSFEKFIWSFVDGQPINNTWKRMSQIPANTKESDALSNDLKKRGFKFVGSTIIYAYMQACGLVNDHVVDCYRYKELK